MGLAKGSKVADILLTAKSDSPSNQIVLIPYICGSAQKIFEDD